MTKEEIVEKNKEIIVPKDAITKDFWEKWKKPLPIKTDFSEQAKKDEVEFPFEHIMQTINKMALRILDQIMLDQIILIYNGKYKTYKAYLNGAKEAYLNSGFGSGRVLDKENYNYIKKQGKVKKENGRKERN